MRRVEGGAKGDLHRDGPSHGETERTRECDSAVLAPLDFDPISYLCYFIHFVTLYNIYNIMSLSRTSSVLFL